MSGKFTSKPQKWLLTIHTVLCAYFTQSVSWNLLTSFFISAEEKLEPLRSVFVPHITMGVMLIIFQSDCGSAIKHRNSGLGFYKITILQPTEFFLASNVPHLKNNIPVIC